MAQFTCWQPDILLGNSRKVGAWETKTIWCQFRAGEGRRLFSFSIIQLWLFLLPGWSKTLAGSRLGPVPSDLWQLWLSWYVQRNKTRAGNNVRKRPDLFCRSEIKEGQEPLWRLFLSLGL